VFLDESGFMLIPTRGRTWSPEGDTPITRYNYKHDRISALATLSVSAFRKHVGLYTRFQQNNFNAMDVASFLRMLLQHLRGEVILLWDRAKIHKGPFIREVCERFPRLHIEQFPAYAPELNPVEFVWQDFKKHTANCLLLDKTDIRQKLHANKRRAIGSQEKLRSFILASQLPSPPW
jgi:putative transposase